MKGDQKMLQRLLFQVTQNLGKNRHAIVVIFAAVGLVGMVTLYLFEGFGANFRDPVDYLSWWMGTATTTGSTAMPETFWGRFVDFLFKPIFFLAGFGFFATALTWLILEATATRRGQGTYRGRGHTVVVGWNEVTRLLVEGFRSQRKQVVLLANEPEEAPPGVTFFVKGDPTWDVNLTRSSVQTATEVLVCLDDDGETLLTAASVKRLSLTARGRVITHDPENADRHTEAGAVAVCPALEIAQTVRQMIEIESPLGPVLIFGQGPVTELLRQWQFEVVAGDPAVDADLLTAGVVKAKMFFIEPWKGNHDSHACLAVASVRAQSRNPDAVIVVILERPENRVHLEKAGARSILCPTEVAVAGLKGV